MTQADIEARLAAIEEIVRGSAALTERVLGELLASVREGSASDAARAVAEEQQAAAARDRIAVCAAHTALLQRLVDAEASRATTSASVWAEARKIVIPAATLIAGALAAWVAGQLGGG